MPQGKSSVVLREKPTKPKNCPLTPSGIVSSGWCDLIQQFGRLFKRAVGSPQALTNEAKARGQKYLHRTKTTAFVSG